MSGTPTKLSDYEGVTKTVQHYIEGAKSGRGHEMKPAFHKDATICFHPGKALSELETVLILPGLSGQTLSQHCRDTYQ